MRIDKFTTTSQEALSDAQSLAVTRDNPYIEPAHLLAAMLAQADGPKALLARAGVDVARLRSALDAEIARLPQVQGGDIVQPGRDLAGLLQAAEREATKRGDQFIASEMVLLAAAESKGSIGTLLKSQGVTRRGLEAAIDAVRGGQKVESAESEGQREALKKYTLDLTERARLGKLDPVIGRDDEIRRAIQVLQRRSKNNPVLIGEPGVGKTAIAEGIAQRIIRRRRTRVAQEQARAGLARHGRCSLAGAKYRGEFEERLKSRTERSVAVCRRADHHVHRRDPHHRRCGCKAEGTMDAAQPLEAGARTRRAALHRRHHPGRVSEIRIEKDRRPGASLPAGDGQ